MLAIIALDLRPQEYSSVVQDHCPYCMRNKPEYGLACGTLAACGGDELGLVHKRRGSSL
jgi:hypothetical protein